jgi:hypothetical protein
MTMVYLVNKPQVSNHITIWLLLFLEYEFIMYKPRHTHAVIYVISRLLNTTEPTSVNDQTIDAALFHL